MKGARTSGAGTCQCGWKTQLKCQRGPVQVGDVDLGHSCGDACGPFCHKELSSCNPQLDAQGLACRRLCHILLSPSLPAHSTCHFLSPPPVGGLCCKLLTLCCIPPLTRTFGWPVLSQNLSVESLRESPTTPLACLGPSPSPGCSSPAHPGWLPAFP